MKGLGLRTKLKNRCPKTACRSLLPVERPGGHDPCDIQTAGQGFERVGHRITGDLGQGSSEGAGYEKVHVRDRRRHPAWLRFEVAG